MRTRTVLSTLCLVAVAVLSGCGSDKGWSGDDNLLSKAELKSSLITLADLGPGFEVDASKDDDSDADLGCLNGLEKLDKKDMKPVRDVEIAFQAEADPNLPAVFNTVGTFRSTKDAAKVLDEFSAAVADCTSIDVTDKDGLRIKLAVSTSTEKVDADATGQVNLEASGTASGPGVELPFSLRFTAIQIGTQVSVVGYVNMTPTLGDEADSVAQRAYDRLDPIADGKKAPTLTPLNLTVIDINQLLAGSA